MAVLQSAKSSMTLGSTQRPSVVHSIGLLHAQPDEPPVPVAPPVPPVVPPLPPVVPPLPAAAPPAPDALPPAPPVPPDVPPLAPAAPDIPPDPDRFTQVLEAQVSPLLQVLLP